MNDEDVKDPQEGQDAQLNEEAQVVQLTAEQYEALLDRIDELETFRESKSKPMSVDALAEEVKPQSVKRATQSLSPQDMDALTNTQLAQLIIDEVNVQVGQYANPIVRDIEELKLTLEIQKAEAKHPDFWDHKDAIHRLGRAQPHLTIEQAYLIASGQAKGKEAKPQTERSESRSKVITGLPPRPYSGEKPSTSVSTRLTDKDPETIKDAATLAWDKVVGKDKLNL